MDTRGNSGAGTVAGDRAAALFVGLAALTRLVEGYRLARMTIP